MSRAAIPCFFWLLVPWISFLVVNLNASEEAITNVSSSRGAAEAEKQFSRASPVSNPRLQQAYGALQAWKGAITDDPSGITRTWVGFDVCSYIGVFCAPAADNSYEAVVAGIDLNHCLLKGVLVEELGFLTDLALFHANTNRFAGAIPVGFGNLFLLAELDLSNNQFSGGFPGAVLSLPSLAFLDLRFNRFRGPLPAQIFDRKLDAIFLNDNLFEGAIPANLGNSPASVMSFANNKFCDRIPPTVGRARGLQEVLFLNNEISGCLPEELGSLDQVAVLDVSFNRITGQLPASLGGLYSVEELHLDHNRFYGEVSDGVCSIQSLCNLTVSFNYYTSEGSICPSLPTARGVAFDDAENCIPERSFQRPLKECLAFDAEPKTCSAIPDFAKLSSVDHRFAHPYPVPPPLLQYLYSPLVN